MKEIDKVLREARHQGFGVRLSRSNHYLIHGPAGQYVTTCSYTPSDSREWRMLVTRLRKVGFIWPKK